MTGRPPGTRRKRELANVHRQLHDRVAAILYRHDPAGLGFGDNADAYEPEAGTILARLPSATSQQDARRIVGEEFVRWFGGGYDTGLEPLADEIWEAWSSVPLRLVGQSLPRDPLSE